MDPTQIPRLIAEVALADRRVRREEPSEQAGQIDMWAGILIDVPYDFAVKASQEHYARSQWPIQPSDIATRWHAEVRSRMDRHTDPTPDVDPNNELEYRRALKAGRTAVAQGAVAPSNVRQLTSGLDQGDVHAMRQQGDLVAFIKASMAEGKRNADMRRALVLRHPDVAAKLLLWPLSYKQPEQWSGAMPPEQWGGHPNNAPERKAILALLAEAEALDAKGRVIHGA